MLNIILLLNWRLHEKNLVCYGLNGRILSVSVMAQVNFGLKSVGAHVGYVMPNNGVDNTIGFGVQSEFGSFKLSNAAFTFGALLNYWSKTYGSSSAVEYSLSELTIAPFVHYNLPLESKFQPYVGGGFGFVSNGFKVDYKTNAYGFGDYSRSSSDFVFFGLAGAKMPVTNNLEGFGEIRYQLGDYDVFSINVGVNYLLGK